MKKIFIITLILVLSACSSSELKTAQDELNKLKVEQEVLKNKIRALEGTAVTTDTHVTLKQTTNFNFTVIDKRSVKATTWDDHTYTIKLLTGTLDAEDSPLVSIAVDDNQVYTQFEIGKRYRITADTKFVQQDENGAFDGYFSIESFEEINE